MKQDRQPDLAAVDASIAWTIDHAGTEAWVKHALRSAVETDPVAAANSAEVLVVLLRRRAAAWIDHQLLEHVARP